MTQASILQYTELTAEELSECYGSTMRKVFLMLKFYPQTREDDLVLFQKYAKHFESPKYIESTIKRYRRLWCQRNQSRIPVTVRKYRQKQTKMFLQSFQQSLQT